MSMYKDKVQRATQYIIDNLGNDLNWLEISRECGISEYHFHRIFSGVMKETPREFIIRKRLEKVILLIAYRCDEISLAQVSLECGYSSQSNMYKAFKNYFGVTPGHVISGKHPENSKIGKIKSKYGKDFDVSLLYPNKEINNDQDSKEIKLNAKIIDIPERKVIFQSSIRGYKKESIHATWTDLLSKLSFLDKPIVDLAKFGVGHDNPQVTPEEKCRYDACVLVDKDVKVPSSFKTNIFPKGKYACFYFKGNDKDLLQFYLDIYTNWFSQNGQEPGDFPLIERYIYVDMDNLEADIELETQILLKS